MINTQTNFIKHLDDNKRLIGAKNRENLQEVKCDFISAIGKGTDAEVAFNEAIKTFQKRVNPSEDMLVTSEKIAEKAKETLKPDSKNFMSWVDAIQATVPMIQVYNEWVNHLNENKDKTHVFYA